VVAGSVSLEAATRRNVVPNVDFLSTGILPSQPGELLAHEDFGTLLRTLSARYDFILMDSAPVLIVSDALVIGTHAGMVFTVVRTGITSKNDIAQMLKRLGLAETKVTGLIFNGLVPRPSLYGYGNAYGSYKYAKYRY
jgi:tyrosine-protein kinase Etk/Wzc